MHILVEHTPAPEYIEARDCHWGISQLILYQNAPPQLFYISVLHVCMYVHHIHASCLVPVGAQKRALNPWSWSYRWM